MIQLYSRLTLLFCLSCLLIACQAISGGPTPTPTPAPTVTPSPTSTPTPDPASPAAFEAFLALIQAEAPAARPPLVNRYMGQLAGAPMAAGESVIFLWRGAAGRVQLLGDMNSWGPDEAPDLSRLEGTDLWFFQTRFEADARLDYRFLVDGRPHLDPLNPLTVAGPQEPNSELRMPAYQAPPEMEPSDREIPTGHLQSHTLDSAALGQKRTFFVYTPAGQQIGQGPAAVYINDGGDYLKLADARTLLDRLVALRRIPPVVAVFIPPISAPLEYRFNDAYVAFLADELAPFVQATYGVDPDPARQGVLGSDLGGLVAIYAALSRPEVFGRGAAQSGAFTVDDEIMVERLAQAGLEARSTAPANALRLYLVVGTYERAIRGRGDVLSANRRLHERLGAIGYEILYEERPEGHSWGMWASTFGRGLTALFGES